MDLSILVKILTKFVDYLTFEELSGAPEYVHWEEVHKSSKGFECSRGKIGVSISIMNWAQYDTAFN